MHGRILTETLREGPTVADWPTETHEAERPTPTGRYRQAITVSRVGKTTYLGMGLGGVE